MSQFLTAISRRPGEFAREIVTRAQETSRREFVVEAALIAVCLAADVSSDAFLDDRGLGQLAGLAAVYAGLLLVRHLFPVLALLAAVLLLYPYGVGGISMLVVIYWAGYRIAGWQRAFAAFTAAMAVSLVVSGDLTTLAVGPLSVAPRLALVLLGVLMPFLLGRFAAQRSRLALALAWQDRHIRRERALLATQARMRERNRIAQDMHDGLGHRLSLISVLSGVVNQNPNLPPEVLPTLDALRTTANAAAAELQDVVGALAPDSDPGDEPGAHTADAIPGLIDTARATGTEIGYHHLPPPDSLSASTSHAAYRIVQEGLTNACKHAPGAAITATVTYEPDAVLVELHNDKPPAPIEQPAPSTRLGLIGLTERVRIAGGALHAGPTPDGGFRVAAILPYDSPAEAPSTVDDSEVDLDYTRSRRFNVHAGTSALVAVAACLLGALILLVWIGISDGGSSVPAKLYDSIPVGTEESAVRDLLPAPTDSALLTIRAGAPPEPESASCLYYLAAEQPSTTPEFIAFRFCFADGRLVDKQTYTTT
ncbi:sensor histidine kinase [Amycolatopsis keratiniphila]|uniref:sensor histidine kinase n=1 Tax=Amycolatopsis keratiniphila TaxID=129921 RepID=UPI0013014C67|nr:histidine kinase [Amycolatopsis keratiniphila]